MKRHLLPLLAISLMASTSHAAMPANAIAASIISADSELSLDLVAPADEQTTASKLSLFVTNEISLIPTAEVDMATLYSRAVKAERLARINRLWAAAQALRAERAAIIADMDKSLAEREAERAQADTAMPEDSPTPIPFSTSRPACLVSLGAPSIMDSLDKTPTANTPEPSTWALFGLGAALMIFVVPQQQLVRAKAVSVKI
jgi:PEP-CTERM motif